MKVRFRRKLVLPFLFLTLLGPGQVALGDVSSVIHSKTTHCMNLLLHEVVGGIAVRTDALPLSQIGKISQMSELMKSAGIEPQDVKRLDVLMKTVAQEANRKPSILSDTFGAITTAADDEQKALVCVLSPTCKINTLGGTSKIAAVHIAIEPEFMVGPFPDTRFVVSRAEAWKSRATSWGSALTQTHPRLIVLPGELNHDVQWIGKAVHEFTHMSDHTFMANWLQANIELLQTGKTADPIFLKYVFPGDDGKFIVHEGFARVFLEGRGYRAEAEAKSILSPAQRQEYFETASRTAGRELLANDAVFEIVRSGDVVNADYFATADRWTATMKSTINRAQQDRDLLRLPTYRTPKENPWFEAKYDSSFGGTGLQNFSGHSSSIGNRVKVTFQPRGDAKSIEISGRIIDSYPTGISVIDTKGIVHPLTDWEGKILGVQMQERSEVWKEFGDLSTFQSIIDVTPHPFVIVEIPSSTQTSGREWLAGLFKRARSANGEIHYTITDAVENVHEIDPVLLMNQFQGVVTSANDKIIKEVALHTKSPVKLLREARPNFVLTPHSQFDYSVYQRLLDKARLKNEILREAIRDQRPVKAVQEFPLEDLLPYFLGFYLKEDNESLRKLMGFITGELNIPERAVSNQEMRRQIQGWLKQQFPELAKIETGGLRYENRNIWLPELTKRFGKKVPVVQWDDYPLTNRVIGKTGTAGERRSFVMEDVLSLFADRVQTERKGQLIDYLTKGEPHLAAEDRLELARSWVVSQYPAFVDFRLGNISPDAFPVWAKQQVRTYGTHVDVTPYDKKWKDLTLQFFSSIFQMMKPGVDIRLDYYKILETHAQADASELKKQYRKLSMAYHPDRGLGDAEKFRQIDDAYKVLSDENKKKMYDRFRTGLD